MMAGLDRLESWRRELQRLQQRRARLTTAWESSLEHLQAAGQPPAPDLLDDQLDYDRQLTALAEEIAREFPESMRRGERSPDVLADLCEELDLKRQARGVLERILPWEHLSEPGFEPLQSLQADARRRLEQLSRSPLTGEQRTMLETLANQEHPLCDLCRLLQSREDLDDATWARLHDRVTEHFGRPLATAIGRGRIRSTAIEPASLDELLPVRETESAALLSDREDAATPQAAATPVESVASPAPEPDFVYDFESTGPRRAGILNSPPERMPPDPTVSPTGAPLLDADRVSMVNGNSHAATGEVRADSGLLEAWAQLRENRAPRHDEPVPHETPAAALAQAALSATGEERVRCMFRLIDQLLIDDRWDLAYHLMRILEGHGSERLTPLPASLIRACLLGRHVCYPQGELNRRVEDDLKRQQPRRHQEFPREERLAYEFLCRAAALLPAMLCASTSAVRLLQAFPIDSGLIQLYNYGSRVASYAEKLQGRTTEMLQSGESSAAASQELGALTEAARTWLAQTLKRTIPYSRSSPLFLHAHWTVMAGAAQRSPETARLWSQWHETWLTVHRLLRPVIRGAGSDRTWVKHELERLAPLLRQEAKSPAAPEAAAAMRGVLQQAVEFASGWLRLGGGSGSSSILPIRELEELRGEIRERSAAVLAELRPFAGIQKSPSLRAATFCLQRIIRQIYSLFEAETKPAWREPELRHLLHAELLKIPCLPLNDLWEPQVADDELEAELLEHVGHGAGTWREAFDAHCGRGDHVTTGRLLELPVWNTPPELTELTLVRQQRISECRRELETDFETLQDEFRSLAESGAFPASDQAAIGRRFERLRSAVGKTLDFQLAEAQLQQLRLMIERRTAAARNGTAPAARLVAAAETGSRRSPPLRDDSDDVPESSSIIQPEPENSWVMDILWEEQ